MGVKRSRRDSVSPPGASSTPNSREQSADVKIVHLGSDSAPACAAVVMKCSLPPHEPLAFASFDEFDIHYQKTHVNRCSECHKNFPDDRFLLLHIAEYHDPIVAAKRDQGEKTVGPMSPCLFSLVLPVSWTWHSPMRTSAADASGTGMSTARLQAAELTARSMHVSCQPVIVFVVHLRTGAYTA